MMFAAGRNNSVPCQAGPSMHRLFHAQDIPPAVTKVNGGNQDSLQNVPPWGWFVTTGRITRSPDRSYPCSPANSPVLHSAEVGEQLG